MQIKHLAHCNLRQWSWSLTNPPLAAFETCDTRQKYAIGGKGVGRLVWVKIFNEIRVESTFEVGLTQFEQLSFKFDPNLEDSLVGLKRNKGNEPDVGTRVLLTEIKPDQNASINRATLARHICHHFFPYFICRQYATAQRSIRSARHRCC